MSDQENAVDLVREFIAAMEEAKEAAHRSVLDGTISCRVCRCLVLEQNADGHYQWHESNKGSHGLFPSGLL